MKEYIVKSQDSICWEKIEKAPIDTYKWVDTEYEPTCYAQVAVLSGKGLAVKMTAFETNPLAEKKNYNDAVCQDSCLEFFVSFDGSKKYFNIEMNSIGTCLADLHETDGTTVQVKDIIGIPAITANKENGKWTVEFLLSFEDIDKLFPGVKIESGYSFRANFYKCGDHTEKVHYGMWNEVTHPIPSFHQPDYFGKLIIE